MTEEKQEFTPIDWDMWDSNYTISMTDILSTNVYKDTQIPVTDDKTLKAVLHLFGLDTRKKYDAVQLPEGASFRSPITGLLQIGGLVYTGRQRKDDVWKKRGFDITAEYLFGGKTGELIKLLNKE